MWNLDLYQNGGIYHHFMPLEHGENKVFNFKPWDGMVYYPLKDIEPQQSVGTHGVGVYPILVVCWAWYLAQECPRCWICQSVGDKSHTGFGVLWGSSNEDQQKQPNEGRKRTDTPHSYCLHIGPTPVPAFPMTRCSPTPSHSKADIAEEKHQSSVAQRRQMEERFWKGLQSILSLVHLGLIFSPKMAILCNSYRESHDTASKFLGYPILRQIHLRKTNYTFNCFHKPRSLRRFTAPETEKSSWRARNDRFARRWRSGVAWFLIPFWLLSCPIFLRVKNVFFFSMLKSQCLLVSLPFLFVKNMLIIGDSHPGCSWPKCKVAKQQIQEEMAEAGPSIQHKMGDIIILWPFS